MVGYRFWLGSIAGNFVSFAALAATTIPLGTGFSSEAGALKQACILGATQRTLSATGGVGLDVTDRSELSGYLVGNDFDSQSPRLQSPGDHSPEDQFIQTTEPTAATAFSAATQTLRTEIGYDALDTGGDIPKLTPAGQSVYTTEDAWKNACGERVVSQLWLGMELYVNVKMDIAATPEITPVACFTSWNFEVGTNLSDLVKGLGNADLMAGYDKEICPHATLSIEALQRGGTPAKLSSVAGGEVVATSDNRALVKYSCAIAKPQACADILNALISYSYDSSGISGQLDQKLPVGSAGGPAVLKYITQDYASFGLFPGLK